MSLVIPLLFTIRRLSFANGVTGNQGVSYIFERKDPTMNVWNQTQKIQFGFTVAMNENFIVADKTVYHRYRRRMTRGSSTKGRNLSLNQMVLLHI